MAAITGIVIKHNRYQDRMVEDRKHLLDAIAGGSAEANKSLAVNILGLPDFEATGTTDTSTATSPILNLTDLGVPFTTPEVVRLITVEAFTSDDNESGWQKTIALVRGHGTTPVVEGSAEQAVTTLVAAIGAEAVTVAVQSNKVVVNCLGIVSDNIRWYVRVWVGDAIALPFLA